MILCRLNRHAFTERDEYGRTTCTRCGKRAPKTFGPIRESDRVMTRKKNRGGEVYPMSKQKRFVKPAPKDPQGA